MRDNELKKVFFENFYRISKSLFLVKFVSYPTGLIMILVLQLDSLENIKIQSLTMIFITPSSFNKHIVEFLKPIQYTHVIISL